MSILALIVWLVVLGILFAVGNYVIDNFMPDPPARMLKVGLVVIICIAVIYLLLALIGIGPGLNLKIA